MLCMGKALNEMGLDADLRGDLTWAFDQLATRMINQSGKVKPYIFQSH